MNRADFLHVRAATKDGTPIAGVLIEVMDGDGRVVTDGLTNPAGAVRLTLPAPPVYTLRCIDADGTVRETPVSSRSGAHTEFIITPTSADSSTQKADMQCP